MDEGPIQDRNILRALRRFCGLRQVREERMAESIDTHLAVIHRVVDSLREEGVTEQNRGEVADAVYAIALSLGALQGRIAALDQGPGGPPSLTAKSE
jgi:DNA-binding IclR family transcriptional regulator